MGSPPYGALAAGVVALAELVLLILGMTGLVRVPPSWFRYASGVAVVAFIVYALSGGSIRADESTTLGKVVSLGLDFMLFTPFLLLLEAGATAYFGFKGRLRYAGLVLLLLAVIALAAGFVYLFLLRLRQGAWR